MSLRFRLTLFYTLFLAFVLLLAATAVYVSTRRSLVASLEDRATQALSEIRNSVEEGVKTLPNDAYFELNLYFGNPNTLEGLQSTIPRGGTYIPRRNPSSVELASLINSNAYERLFREGSTSTRVELPNGVHLLVRGALTSFSPDPNLANRMTPFPATVFVGFPLPTERLAQLRLGLFYTVMFAFIIFAVGVWILSQRVLYPVKRVTEAAAGVSGRDLSQRVPVPKTRDEVSELAITLNHMLDRLQESFETQRRFTADASHELRTPVTAISGHANYLLRRTKPSPEQMDSLTVIRREAARMTKLVNDLLELARADAGFTVDKRPMNLVEVVEAVHMEVAPVAGNATIEVSSPQPLVEVMGDESRLKQVVLNLVQNALNAGATHVTISLFREKQGIRLEIFDNGPGIPKEAIPHLFDRFYRVDGARSTRGNGSGLGLAIVKWIVQQHGGEVSVESRLGEGTVFTVLLPAPSAPSGVVRHRVGVSS